MCYYRPSTKPLCPHGSTGEVPCRGTLLTARSGTSQPRDRERRRARARTLGHHDSGQLPAAVQAPCFLASHLQLPHLNGGAVFRRHGLASTAPTFAQLMATFPCAIAFSDGMDRPRTHARQQRIASPAPFQLFATCRIAAWFESTWASLSSLSACGLACLG